MGPATGKVKWFSEKNGYGFITSDDGRDCFVHKTQIHGSTKLREGDEVAFEMYNGQRGLHARNVSAV